MSESQVDGSEQPSAIAKEIESAPSVGARVKSRVKRWSVSILPFLLFGLPVTLAFEHFASKDALTAALKAQTDFYDAVSSLNPLHLLWYLGEAHEWIFWNLDDFLQLFLPIYLVNKIMYLVPILIWGFVLGMSPVIILVGAFREASTLEFVLIMIVLIPFFIGLAGNNGKDETVGIIIIGLVVAMLFYWFLQLAMLGSLLAFGKLISLAEGWCATSIIASFGYACLSKTTEHSLMEAAMHAGKKGAAHLGRRLIE